MAIRELILVLEQMSQVYTVLLQLEEQKKPAIIANRVDELSQIMQQEAKLMILAEQLEARRSDTVREFTQSQGLPQHGITMNELPRLVFQLEERKSLILAQDTLAQIVMRVKEMNDLNRQLVQHSLAFIDYSLDLFMGSPEQEFTYSRPTAAGSAVSRSGFINVRA